MAPSIPLPDPRLPVLEDILATNETWLIERVLGYAGRHGSATYTSALDEVRAVSIRGLSDSLATTVRTVGFASELEADEGPESQAAVESWALEAKRRLSGGTKVGAFLALMKYHRYAYIDLFTEKAAARDREPFCRATHVFFDRAEIIACDAVVDAAEDRSVKDRFLDPTLRDTVTGLLDRRGFQALCTERLGSTREGLVELLYFDLDDVKRINDTYGHAVGDQALIAFGGLLERVFRDSDTVARMGGDEFAVLAISERRSDEDALAVRFSEALRALNESKELPFWISTSMGRAAWDLRSGACVLDALIREADACMYEMKRKRHEGW